MARRRIAIVEEATNPNTDPTMVPYIISMNGFQPTVALQIGNEKNLVYQHAMCKETCWAETYEL